MFDLNVCFLLFMCRNGVGFIIWAFISMTACFCRECFPFPYRLPTTILLMMRRHYKNMHLRPLGEIHSRWTLIVIDIWQQVLEQDLNAIFDNSVCVAVGLYMFIHTSMTVLWRHAVWFVYLTQASLILWIDWFAAVLTHVHDMYKYCIINIGRYVLYSSYAGSNLFCTGCHAAEDRYNCFVPCAYLGIMHWLYVGCHRLTPNRFPLVAHTPAHAESGVAIKKTSPSRRPGTVG